ncbi:MAG: low molecular weight phosphatase family protein [Nanoarchaeota archaeon]|nr:low molecular weight phosphatase family protein [Nanoarchaeota archaeon]
MKILFVCKYNLGRSRMADFFFNNLTKKHSAESAGAYTHYYKKNYGGEIPKGDQVIKLMNELGIDVTKKRVRQLNKKLVDSADMVIAIMSEKRANLDLPSYTRLSRKFKLWKIEDVSGTLKKSTQYEMHKKNRDEILKRVKELIKELR